MKKLLKALKIAEMEATKADEAWEADPENEELEAAFDEAYSKEFEARENLAKAIVKTTFGKIDIQTARNMIRIKRMELETLISKMA